MTSMFTMDSVTRSRRAPRDRIAGRTVTRLIVALRCDDPLAPPHALELDELDELVVGRARHNRATARPGELRARRVEIADSLMSSTHVRLRRDGGRWIAGDAGSKNGTFVNGARIDETALEDGDVVEVGATTLVFRRGRTGDPTTPQRAATADVPPVFRTLNTGLSRDLALLARVAPTDAPVLVFGDTGTGKELAARAVHELSGRPGPFVAVNCGALPPTLVESELFGYRRGAFSGACEDRAGLIRAAHTGTLFLDEVAELPATAQAALLRALQEREVLPLGATTPVDVDVRVVAATHRALPELVDREEFRRDLYARLSGFEVTLPPLRDRREDLGALIAAMLPRVTERPETVTLTPEAARVLFAHDWPDNARELEQTLRVAAAIAAGEAIAPHHLPERVRARPGPAPLRRLDAGELRDRLLELTRDHRGNVSAIARALSTSRGQVRRWYKRFDIDPAAYRVT